MTKKFVTKNHTIFRALFLTPCALLFYVMPRYRFRPKFSGILSSYKSTNQTILQLKNSKLEYPDHFDNYLSSLHSSELSIARTITMITTILYRAHFWTRLVSRKFQTHFSSGSNTLLKIFFIEKKYSIFLNLVQK